VKKNEKPTISFFERNLTFWVAICMVIGVLIGKFLPAIPEYLTRFEYAKVSIPIAVLIWLMIFPMMMKVDFASIKDVGKNPKGLLITWMINWLIKPFSMFAIAYFFFFVLFQPWISPELGKDYLAGAVLLGAAPCTAMVFVWSHLTGGNAAYTVVQVATNDLIILIAFTPIVAFLLGIGGIAIPWVTLMASVVLFVVVPLLGGLLTRNLMIRAKGESYFQNEFLPKFNHFTIAGLLLTLVLIFAFQGDVIIHNPLHIVLIAVPLIIQTVVIFFLAYGLCFRLRCQHEVAAPAGMIGASNFFELAVAVAITLFGAASPVVLATIVGVLVEVPVMLALVSFANRTRGSFASFETSQDQGAVGKGS
jgi:ACR3 family arsenite transporter